MTETYSTDARTAFASIAGAEIGSYMTMHGPSRAVISCKSIAECNKWTLYRARKAVRELVADGLVERASCGCPAVESCGEYRELDFEAAPPLNGFALTKKGFESEMWKEIYKDWEKSMAEWAEGGSHES